ncbi:hypothetical protein V8C40DRAFT_186598 [Trichoderma camerunense]
MYVCVYQQRSNMEAALSLYCVKSKTRYKRRFSFVALLMHALFLFSSLSLSVISPLSLSFCPPASPFISRKAADRHFARKGSKKGKKRPGRGRMGRRGGRMGVGAWSLFAYTSTLCLYQYQLCALLIVLVMGPYIESLAHVHGLFCLHTSTLLL